MKIAHFLASMKPDHDGVARVIYRLRHEFSEHSGDSHIFVSSEVPASAPQDMFAIKSIPFPLSSGYRLAVTSSNQMVERLKKIKPDVVHLHSPCSLGAMTRIAAERLGIPVVATYHTHFPTYLKYYGVPFLKPFVWKYLKFFYGYNQAIIIPSKSTKDELEEQGFRNLVHIPHGVDTRGFSPRFRSDAWRRSVGGANKTIVSFVGRLVWEKNLEMLADAFQHLKHLKSLKFVVVGDGPARAELQRMMPKAHFTGFLGAKDLPTAYASSDIFAFPSLTETFGNVTVEAMASGLPAVCLARGGACDIVNHGVNGHLIPNSRHKISTREFADAIRDIALSPSYRSSLGAAALVSAKKYRWDLTASRYRDLYQDVVR